MNTSVNLNAIIMFLIFVMITMGITYWASKRTRNSAEFYTAGGNISGMQNGLALAGDYMSASSFLGITGMLYMFGFDGMLYLIGTLLGWPIILFLLAEQMRNLGKYTFADVISFRLQQRPVRIFAATASLVVLAFYLVAQMVGAGKLIQLLFGLQYWHAIFIVGILMTTYVIFGGMAATTWVQIIKVFLLLCGAAAMAWMVLSHFSFDLNSIFKQATQTHPLGERILGTGFLVKDPLNAFSLGIALLFGVTGLPHVLMRFFTVKNAQDARKSVFYATGCIAFFYLLIIVIGYGAIVILSNHPEFFKPEALIDGVVQKQSIVSGFIGGSNMVAVKLSQALGGDIFYGFIAAVAFATILAVVSGMCLSGASAISHDLYAQVFAKGKPDAKTEMAVGRIATFAIGLVAIGLGIIFEAQNVAFMGGLALAIAASANFPVLVMTIFWSKTTTKGVIWGGVAGLVSALLLTCMSKAVWGDVFGFVDSAGKSIGLIGLDNPAIISMPLAFIGIIVVSLLDNSKNAIAERAAFKAQNIRCQTGLHE